MSVLAALSLLLAAQDKIKIEVRSAKGEVYVHETKKTNEGTIVVTFGGMDHVQPMKELEVHKYRDEVLEVEGALPSKVRRENREWWEEKSRPGAPEPEKRVLALQGKTVVITRKDGKSQVEGADGIPEHELWRSRLRHEAMLRALPTAPVAVGETWAVDEKLLMKDFADDAAAKQGPNILTAKAQGKLEKVEEHRGVRCAVVVVAIDAVGHLPNQPTMKLEMAMTARMWIDLDKGRPLTMKGEGTGKLAGEIVQGDQKIAMKGDLKFVSEAQQTYE